MLINLKSKIIDIGLHYYNIVGLTMDKCCFGSVSWLGK